MSSDGRLHSSPSDSNKIGTSDVGKSSRGGSTKGRGKYRDTENRNRRHEIQDKSTPISENQEQINSETIMKRHQESRNTYDKSIPISENQEQVNSETINYRYQESQDTSENSEFQENQEKIVSAIPDIQCPDPNVPSSRSIDTCVRNSPGEKPTDHKHVRIEEADKVTAESNENSTQKFAKLANEGVDYDMNKEVRIVLLPRSHPHTEQAPNLDIPEEIQKFLRIAHGPHRGHLGFDATVENLFGMKGFRRKALRGGLPGEMESFIRTWLKSCDTCQKMSVKRPVVQAAHFTCSVYKQMERVAIDYIESLPKDKNGNDMIIVIIDCFSRFIFLYPVQSTKSFIFAEVFLKWIGTFGSPKEILSDQGSQFMSKLIQDLFDLSGIEGIKTIGGSKQENAIVERANREVMRHIRNIVYDRRVFDSSSYNVPFAQRIMNSMIHSSTGVKPCEIVFGKEIGMEIITTADGEDTSICTLRSISLRNDRDIEHPPVNPDNIRALEVEEIREGEEEWLTEIKKAQQVAMEVARHHLISNDTKHMLSAPREIDSFEVGELVLIEQGSSFRRGPENKLLPFLAGPYTVENVNRSEYTLRNCITRKTKKVHLSNLHRYISNEYNRKPEEAVMRDFRELFIVERIVEEARETDPKGRVKNLKFKVEWKGYPGQDTWESWKELRRLEVFKNFLLGHKKVEYQRLARKLSTEVGETGDDEGGEIPSNRRTTPEETTEEAKTLESQVVAVTKKRIQREPQETEEGTRKGGRERKKSRKMMEGDL